MSAAMTEAMSAEPAATRQRCGSLTQRFRHEADSEYGLLGLVQELHLPFGVWLQAAGNATEKIGANAGHLGPRSLATRQFRSLIGRAGIAAVANPEEIQRHH